jgi:hypothetical protein
MKSQRVTSFQYLILIISLGFGLRLIAAAWGHNYDYESYRMVTGLVEQGANVYAGTSRYNYGPLWFMVLGNLNSLAKAFPWNEQIFRLLLVGLLSYADLLIAVILALKFKRSAGLLYWLNPVSIIITGYFNQFDNLAVLLAMLAMLMLPKRFKTGLVILGISLATKHVFAIFPLWLFFRAQGAKNKLLAIIIPCGIFALSFVPFVFAPGALNGILENVFRYSSLNNHILIGLFYNGQYATIFAQFIFAVSLILAGLFSKKFKLWQSFFFYTLTLVVLTPSLLPYYFAIVLPVLAVSPNLYAYGFYGATTLLLLSNYLGMNIKQLVENFPSLTDYLKSGNNIFYLPVGFLVLYYFNWLVKFIKPLKEHPLGHLVHHSTLP